MKRTTIVKLALCAAIMFASIGANAQKNEFKKLAKIEGVEHVHINKLLINLAAKKGGNLNLGDEISIGDKSSDLLKKINNVNVFTCEAKDAAEKMGKHVRNILGGNGWEPLVDAKDEDGEKVKIYQNQRGKHTTVAIFAEEEKEATLVVIDGELDIAKMMEQMNK